MSLREQWIWLPNDIYPSNQTTKYSGFNKGKDSYCVAEFKKKYSFEKKVVSARLRFSADTTFQLFCNDRFIASGPPYAGGDFLGNDKPLGTYYAMETDIHPDSKELDFVACVRLMPIQIYEYSKGHGGVMISAQLTFEDGTWTTVSTDSGWLARLDRKYVAPDLYDGTVSSDEYVPAEEIKDIWHCKTAPIRLRTEYEISGETILLKPYEKKDITVELDMIYAGYMHLIVKTKGILKADVSCAETNDTDISKSFVIARDDEYRGFELCSVGKLSLSLENESEYPSEISAGIIAVHYPVDKETKTVTSDEELNSVLRVCAHTLKQCRQLMHLDSPRHCEPLACTGDYYIESLMTAFSFGDMSLAKFDIIRTADTMRENDGRLFHTTYSLIWVLMLYDVYMITGCKDLISDCEDALALLMKRFDTYIGENGLIEFPPDYMFVDWIYVDGLSMHHPPKALGQTCLNMFYFAALATAEKIYTELGDNRAADMCRDKKEKLKNVINTLLFDRDKGLYFEGLNTKTPERLLGQYMPQNTDKRYYLKHSNILAACFGVCDKNTSLNILDKIMSDQCHGDYQPYFAHFLLEAIYKNGLRDKYTLKVLEQWKKPIAECSKGLIEGFVAPEPSYSFDHSHAWGGTPLYSLPRAVMGIEIIEAGMKKIYISPSAIGLESVHAEFPTPYGDVICEIKAGEEPVIICPKEIEIINTAQVRYY